MERIIDIIENLNDVLVAQGATEVSVDKAENELQLIFSDEYKEYATRYGLIAYDGHELTGISNNPRTSVVDVTQKEWALNPNISHDMYVVEEANIDGIVIWQNESGAIFQSQPNCPISKICNSICDFISM